MGSCQQDAVAGCLASAADPGCCTTAADRWDSEEAAVSPAHDHGPTLTPAASELSAGHQGAVPAVVE